jgi:hypothetical protein
MNATWIAVALGTSILLALGCAFGEFRWNDPLKRQFTLEDIQKQYTDYVRWNAFGKASVFVDPEVREAYLAGAPKIDELRFTDYESAPVTLDEEMGEATVEVTYSAYRPHSPIEIEVTEVQRWRRHGKGNYWLVRPTFSGPSQLLGSRDPQ